MNLFFVANFVLSQFSKLFERKNKFEMFLLTPTLPEDGPQQNEICECKKKVNDQLQNSYSLFFRHNKEGETGA